ncbi:hypothetical protein H010_10596 [Hydrogenophaga taeniospiralis CCUG 15921]|uniref:Uncharacterized protein n=1 Tax=Hydrogenophaga taeniospiralis CCUG 15921 TaxID=1281780 RepID=A0A9X4P3U9_9BURK|nr:hypothetical protein [Hydrogenophaga taeniospiralis]MDG5975703.1 hypothetical protein [Hydrogenophaga taeniospiralis CCUG 15921]
MTTTQSDSNSAPLPQTLPVGRLEGREAFAGLVRQALACAAHEGWPRLVLSDPDFADWPLGERAVVESLQAWAGHGRHIQFMARDFAPLRQLHPRLVQWRTTWSHLVEAHACTGATGADLPSAIWSPGWTLERLDVLRCTLVASNDAERRVALRERLDACWHKGSPSFAATTLGL